MPYISDMDADSPLSTDPISQGDDQLRSIKLDVQSSFPGVDAAVPATSADLNAATEAQTAKESGNGVTPTLTGHQTGYAPRYGLIEGSVADQSVALQAALDSGYLVELPPGNYNFGTTLTLPTGTNIMGAGSAQTTLTYTGVGIAMESNNKGARTYSWSLSKFKLTGATGTVGVDFTNVSTCSCYDLVVRDFDVNIKILADSAGWAVYNRFYDVTAQQGTVRNWSIEGIGCNATELTACRSAGGGITPVGIYIADSNEVMVSHCQIEGHTDTGIQIRATGAYGSTGGAFISQCRFENNTTHSIDVGTGFNIARILDNYSVSTGGTVLDNGTGTFISGFQNESTTAIGSQESTNLRGDTAPAWSFERSGAGLPPYPAFQVLDTNSGGGDPVTLQVRSARSTDASRALAVGTVAGTDAFAVRGDGRLYTNQVGPQAGGLGSAGHIPLYDPATGSLIGYIDVQAP
jgi:hypothetical protein